MVLLKRKVEYFIGIVLKIMPRWLVNDNCLQKSQELNNKPILRIIIIFSSESEAK